MKPKAQQTVSVQALPVLTITVTKTANGQQDYVQIMSGDQFSLNIVLIANKITVEDRRLARPPESK